MGVIAILLLSLLLLFKCNVMYTLTSLPHWHFSGPMKQTIEINLTGLEFQVAGSRPFGRVQGRRGVKPSSI